jgi:pimeloyl-ACP methyl ester carboxylesterase
MTIKKQRPALLMLSGHLCSEKLWESQIKAFAEDYECLPYVFRQGDSIESYAQQVLESAPASFSLVGLSMGGYVAFEIMRRAPMRVERLALLDTSAEADTPARTAQRYVDIQSAEELGLEAFAKILPSRWMHPIHQKQDAFRQSILEMVLSVGHTAQKQQVSAMINRVDSFPTLKAIKCPTLVLCGREDLSTPVSMHEDIARLVPDSRLVIVEQCGHLSTMEQPEIVNASLRQWLTR